ncbi:MAG TPA: hypothetical protein VH374_18455 [Polyangia bacterium]|nr:hypothetical protein [Polyangia bacterium]
MTTLRIRALGVLLLTLVATACSSTPVVVSTHDLDRPTDMVFGCVGLIPLGEDAAEAQPSGRPMGACQNVLPVTSIHRTFAFVTNSARGELSVIDMDVGKLVDLDLAVAGFSTVPLGELPEALAISDDGCRVVSANRGSCDLTLVDPGLLVAPTIARQTADAGVPEQQARPPTQTVVVRTGSGKALAASPFEIQFLPQDTSTLATSHVDDSGMTRADPPDISKLCPADHPLAPPLGWKADGTLAQTGWKAMVTFPNCDLVALVDLPSGLIVDSVKVRTDGKNAILEPTGTEPSCPIECGVGPRPATAVDGGADGGDATAAPDAPGGGAPETAGDDETADGGVPDATDSDATTDGDDDGATIVVDAGDASAAPDSPPPIGPSVATGGALGVGPLALHPLGFRAYVGLTNAPIVAAIDVEPDTGALIAPADVGASIPLVDALGVRRVRLSVDPFSTAKNVPFVSRNPQAQDRKFLYVIADDGTVRVVDVDSQQECDNNVDPKLLPTADDRATMIKGPCLTVADAAAGGLHNPLVPGPGIRLPSNPRDVVFTNVGQAQSVTGNGLEGAFGFILTDSGAVYLTNVDPVTDPTKHFVTGVVNGAVAEIPQVPPLPNSLRDQNFVNYNTTLDLSSGPPRLDVVPVAPVYGARIEGFWAEDTADNYLITAVGPPVKTYAYFPDREVVTPQTWTATWEGGLIGLRFSGLRKGPYTSPETNTDVDSFLYDAGGGFCQAGVVAGDIVTMVGCSTDAQCGAGLVCVHSDTVAPSANGLAINGLCVNPDPATQATELKTCRRLLESVRRYEVVIPHPDRLALRPLKDEVVQSSLDPARCMRETDEKGNGVPCGPPSAIDPSYSAFRCKNVGGPDHDDLRCVNPCGQPTDTDPHPTIEKGDVDCRPGRKCVDFGSRGGRLCADAPSEATEQPSAHGCFPQLTTYSVQAGRSFLVQGTATGIPMNVPTFDPSATPPAAGNPPPTFPVFATDPMDPLRDQNLNSNDSPLICVPPTPSNTPLAYRIPLDAPLCPDQHFAPGLDTMEKRIAVDSNALPTSGSFDAGYIALNFLRQLPSEERDDPNPCLYVAGPNEGDPTVTPTSSSNGGADGGANGGAPTAANVVQHVRARFRNTEIQFILSNLEQQYTTVAQLRMDVHGGFSPAAVVAPATVEIGLPARILTSPLPSLFQGPDPQTQPDSAPYLFVVDQRRVGLNRLAGGATRGQVLRINPQRYNPDTTLPPLLIYDDLTASAGLFPIQ